MAQFSKIIITDEGKKMLNQAFSFGKKVDFTEASTSEKSYEEGELFSLCELQEIRQTIPIEHVAREGDTIEIKLVFENNDLENGYYLRTLGIYAEMEGEAPVLFAAVREQTENLYIPAGKTAVSGASIKLKLQLESEAAVQLVVDKAGVATVGDVLMISNELAEHQQDQENPHRVTKSQVGLGSADNTSDMDKPVSTAQQTAFDHYYQQSAEYTDQKIAQLVDGAPETLDTLKEVADALSENETVMGALNEAIGKKMDKEEALSKTGDSKENTVTFTSEDKLEPASWSNVPVLENGEKHSNIFNKVSAMFQNIRWLYKRLGTTNISSLGGGTVTGAISKLNTDLNSHTGSSSSHVSSTERNTWNGKQNSIIGAASTITSSNLTGNRVLISDSSGKVSASGVTSAELMSAVPGYGGMYHTNSGFMTVSNANWTKVPIDAGAGNDCIRYNSSLKRLDILKAGHYAFLGSVTISSTGNAGYVKGVKILKDGIDVGYYATTKCVSTAPWTTISTPLFANSFSAGGYLELYFRDEGGSATIGHTYLTVIKVG